MEYKTVPDGGRYYVVNKDSFGILREVTPNLNENELRITRLEAEGCPIEELCLNLNYGIISVCNHMGAYPTSAMSPEGELVFDEMPCDYSDSPSYLAVRVLAVGNCPIGESSCLECQHIKDIIIPSGPNPNKSHACLICGLAKA